VLHAVIMAGGSGTRFWPASRKGYPKQFLSLFGEKSLIQQTWDRCLAFTEPSRCWVVTGALHADLVREQLPDLPPENLLVEPCPRNTAAAIGLAAVRLRARDPDSVMAVLPSDHLIAPLEKFSSDINTAANVVEAAPESLALFGIRPTFPATGYGYIELGEPLAHGENVRRVARFREKPDRTTAEAFLASKNFLWNGGIFVWRGARILETLRRHEPELAAGLERIAAESDWDTAVRTQFPGLKSISIDYAVLEREAASCVVVEAGFEWDDVGSWEAVARRQSASAETGADGNVVHGLHRGIETTGTIVQTTSDHLVATIGIEDLLIVHTKDATLVARRNDEEGLRRLIESLKASGLDHLL